MSDLLVALRDLLASCPPSCHCTACENARKIIAKYDKEIGKQNWLRHQNAKEHERREP